MIKIIPAILPTSFSDIERKVQSLLGIASSVQIDFVDGVVAPQRTWPFNNKEAHVYAALLREDQGLPFWDEINYEFDLMVANPLEHIDTFVALGPSKIIFHAQTALATKEMQDALLSYLESLPEIVRTTIEFGIAVTSTTDYAILAPYIPYISTIQCMGISRIGFQGQPFDESVIAYVASISKAYPTVLISVDGGMNTITAPQVVAAGAKQIIAGSAIFGGAVPQLDTIGAFRALKHACSLNA